MELNGARSNPRAGVEFVRLGALHDELLRKALINPREPRPVPAKVSPVLETMTLALELAGEPMRAREIHAAAEKLADEPLLWTSVKAALAAGTSGPSQRFRSGNLKTTAATHRMVRHRSAGRLRASWRRMVSREGCSRNRVRGREFR